MSWADFYRRRDALDRVVESGELTVPDMFDGPTEVLLALQHRWSLQLAGRVELAEREQDRAGAVGAAWREAADANPGLRGLLDRYANHPALRAAVKDEHRMLAVAAGVTGPGDGPAEQAIAGARFVARLREQYGNPVERFLRKLVPSG